MTGCRIGAWQFLDGGQGQVSYVYQTEGIQGKALDWATLLLRVGICAPLPMLPRRALPGLVVPRMQLPLGLVQQICFVSFSLSVGHPYTLFLELPLLCFAPVLLLECWTDRGNGILACGGFALDCLRR